MSDNQAFGVLEELSRAVMRGNAETAESLTKEAIESGLKAEVILKDGLLASMAAVGVKFKNNEVFVPEVLVAARAMNRAMAVLKPLLVGEKALSGGKVVIGTVKGDLHDIGKNLVKIMFESKGISVVDLGVSVPAERFIEAAISERASIICCSALLTSTMYEMKNVVEEAKKAGLRDKVKIMVGGAPINSDFCKEVGADYYSPDAQSAAEKAAEILGI
ncbi:MAG: corrinoid protein [Eubacteriales bacterium]